jgi:hypothetical protein
MIAELDEFIDSHRNCATYCYPKGRSEMGYLRVHFHPVECSLG